MQIASFAYRYCSSSLDGTATYVDDRPAYAAPDQIAKNAPSDIVAYFGGAPAAPGARAPQILYPFDGAMMAPNVLQVRVQWDSPGALRYFRLVVQGADPSAGPYQRFYSVCSPAQQSGCTFTVDDKLWSALAHQSLGKALTLTVSGVAKQGDPVATSAPITVRFSPEDIRGGLYYFSPTIRGIKRVPLGASQPVDFITNGNGTGCAGCHAVSRDGKQVAVEFGTGQTRVGSSIVDGVNPSSLRFALDPATAWNFAWFNPTGDLLVTNWNGALAIRTARDGKLVTEVPPALYGGTQGAVMPEWSPDGKWLAFVRLRAPARLDFAIQDSGDIVVMPYNNGNFGPATTLVCARPGSEAHFWPSWSPDSRFLVFNTESCDPQIGCVQYDAPRTRLRLVRAISDSGLPVASPGCGQLTAQPPVIELYHGTHERERTTNWPKFAPFLQGGRYAFVVYSAKYAYGLTPASTRAQLFMFALDLQQAATSMDDPSFQPVWLPFQEENTSNHSAIWTTDVVCQRASDCPSEFSCQGGVCAPILG